VNLRLFVFMFCLGNTNTPVGYNKSLIKEFIETELIVLGPICRHYCEHIWLNILGKKATLLKDTWIVCLFPF
jgi:leucyl-tRNA synthetase